MQDQPGGVQGGSAKQCGTAQKSVLLKTPVLAYVTGPLCQVACFPQASAPHLQGVDPEMTTSPTCRMDVRTT